MADYSKMKQFIATDTTGHKMLIDAESLQEAQDIAEERIGESLVSVSQENI